MSGKKCARLVLTVVREQPTRTSQDCTTKPHGSHGSLKQRYNKVAKCGSTPPRRCCTSKIGKIDEGMGPHPSNVPARYPGGECHQQNLEYNLSAIRHSLFPECKKRDRTTCRLRLNLRGEKSLSTHLLLTSPPSSTHPGNNRS